MYWIISLLLVGITLSAQTFVETRTLGNFEKAIAFTITSNNHIYVTDGATCEIYKMNLNGNLESSTGGYGWELESFDNPIDIFADALNVYITDHNNHRIQRFDKDLNYLSVFSSENISESDYKFLYPLACEVSNQGDMFILDGDNARILKYDLNGNFVLEIGNIDAGKNALEKPASLAISNDGKLFVADDESVVVFDFFGNSIARVNFGEFISSLSIYNNILVANNESNIFFWNLQKPDDGIQIFTPELAKQIIVNTRLIDNQLFLLTETNIIMLEQKVN
jgi:DNA-binding beta-propeller fold protein YncE